MSGAVAQLLGRPGWANATPAQIKTELLTHMVSTGVISGLDAASPNKLLYIAPPPVAGGSSIAVARNKDGRLGLFGVTRDGNLLYRTQVSAGSTDWTGWTTSRNIGGWYSVAAQTDGRDRISFVGLRRTPQNIWYRAQGQPNVDDGWTNPHQVAGLLNSIAVARSSRGRLELFGTNSAGQLWQSYKTTVTGVNDFTPWSDWDVPMHQDARSVAAELNANNEVEVFALTSFGQLYHHWETSPDAAQLFTPWSPLDPPAGATLSSIALARNSDGSLQLFGTTTDGQVYTTRDTGTNDWLPWAQLPNSLGVDAVRWIAAETNTDGRVELFAVDTTGRLWHRYQTTQGADTYSVWTPVPGTLLRP